MPYDPNLNHGSCEYLSWKQLSDADASEIISNEPADGTDIDSETDRFAMLVHVTNPATVELTGDLEVNTDDLETLQAETNTKLDTLNAQTFEQRVAAEYDRIIIEDSVDDSTYMMHAVAGTSYTANTAGEAWRIQKIDQFGSRAFAEVIAGTPITAFNLAIAPANPDSRADILAYIKGTYTFTLPV